MNPRKEDTDDTDSLSVADKTPSLLDTDDTSSLPDDDIADKTYAPPAANETSTDGELSEGEHIPGTSESDREMSEMLPLLENSWGTRLSFGKSTDDKTSKANVQVQQSEGCERVSIPVYEKKEDGSRVYNKINYCLYCEKGEKNCKTLGASSSK